MHIRMVAVLAFVALTACATNKGNYTRSDDVERRLRGMSEAELVTKLGAPTETVKLSNGDLSWSYRDKAGGLTGGACTVNVVLKNGVVTTASVQAHDRSFVSFPLGSCKNILSNLD